MLLELVIWGTQVPAYIWGLICEGLGESSSDTKRALVFLVIVHFFRLAVDAGWDLYFALDIKERHGFNKLTARLYLRDKTVVTFFWATLGVLAF
jgi:hypothetical protein